MLRQLNYTINLILFIFWFFTNCQATVLSFHLFFFWKLNPPPVTNNKRNNYPAAADLAGCLKFNFFRFLWEEQTTMKHFGDFVKDSERQRNVQRSAANSRKERRSLLPPCLNYTNLQPDSRLDPLGPNKPAGRYAYHHKSESE